MSYMQLKWLHIDWKVCSANIGYTDVLYGAFWWHKLIYQLKVKLMTYMLVKWFHIGCKVCSAKIGYTDLL